MEGQGKSPEYRLRLFFATMKFPKMQRFAACSGLNVDPIPERERQDDNDLQDHS